MQFSFSFLVLLSKYFSLLEDSQNKYYVFFIILGCNLIIWFKAEGISVQNMYKSKEKRNEIRGERKYDFIKLFEKCLVIVI